jgi:superfamily II RNA helicase
LVVLTKNTTYDYIITGNNVLVTTPTGSGKTLVGELAIYFALMMGLRVAYTTPLKALSNQKFKDFKERFGADRVGLLTGDIAINRGAAITIMTTEVFRNMIYDVDSKNQLSNLFMVCFDEFHFMNDPERGTVWEESIISCPPSVRILALSATMGNVADIQGWISSIHGPTSLVASEYRPVPLRYMFAMKQGMFPLFRNPFAGPGATAGVSRDSNGQLEPGMEINPTIMKFEDRLMASQSSSSSQMGGRDGRGRFFKTSKSNPNGNIAQYSDIVEELCQLQQVPAIVFIFSRAGCEQSAKMVMQTKKKLLTSDDITYINNALSKFIRTNPDIPVAKENVAMLRAGVGVHHAGLIGVWKAFIEDLFNANKIKVLFATETLAAGESCMNVEDI